MNSLPPPVRPLDEAELRYQIMQHLDACWRNGEDPETKGFAEGLAAMLLQFGVPGPIKVIGRKNVAEGNRPIVYIECAAWTTFYALTSTTRLERYPFSEL